MSNIFLHVRAYWFPGAAVNDNRTEKALLEEIVIERLLAQDIDAVSESHEMLRLRGHVRVSSTSNDYTVQCNTLISRVINNWDISKIRS